MKSIEKTGKHNKLHYLIGELLQKFKKYKKISFLD